jgi:hypothetical protein
MHLPLPAGPFSALGESREKKKLERQVKRRAGESPLLDWARRQQEARFGGGADLSRLLSFSRNGRLLLSRID